MIGRIGAGIIILAFILSVLSPYVLMFTIPAFILGLILVWIGKNKPVAKALWTFLPLLLWYPTFWLYMLLNGIIGTAAAQKFDFIFQNNFKGKMILIGPLPCGQPVQRKDGREQLFVPDNGILLYQGDVESGFVNHRYFYRLSNGNLKIIPARANYMYVDDNKNPPPSQEVGVWHGGFSARGLSEIDPEIEYRGLELTVDSKDSIGLHNEFQKERRFQTLTDSIIRACKENPLHYSKKKF